MEKCLECMYGLGSNLEDKEMELQAALRNHCYTGDYVKEVIGQELFNALKEKDGKFLYEETVRIELKKTLQCIAQIKRDLNTLGLEVGDVPIDPTLGIIDDEVVDGLFYHMFDEYGRRSKHNCLFGSKEDIKVNCNALRKKMCNSIINMHCITVSIKDIMQRDPNNFVIVFWNTIRKRLFKIIRKNSKNGIEKKTNLFEFLRMRHPQKKLSKKSIEDRAIRTCIIIPDIEELFKCSIETRTAFFKMYEILIGRYSPDNLRKYLEVGYVDGYDTNIFPIMDEGKTKHATEQELKEYENSLEEGYKKEVLFTWFIFCGSKESVASLDRYNEENKFPFLNYDRRILS